MAANCLLAEPTSKSNAYYAYTYGDKDMQTALGRGSTAAEVAKLRSALMSLLEEVAGTCEKCGLDGANFFWLPASVFDDKWWSFDLRRIADSEFDFSVLCGPCAAQAVTESMDAKEPKLGEIWIPFEGTVLMFSGEA